VSILNEPFFKKVEDYFNVHTYKADRVDKVELRPWIDMFRMPPDLEREALDFTKACVKCGDTMHPFRMRKGKNGRFTKSMYYAATCSQDDNKTCSKGPLAHKEYKAITTYFKKEKGKRRPPTKQLMLF